MSHRPRRITLYHHPGCARCRKYARMHRRMDWLHRLDISADVPPTGPLVMGEILVVDQDSGRVLRGIEAVRKIFRSIPAYWLILPFFYVPPIARRIDLEARGCRDGSCAVAAPTHDVSDAGRG